eukprot:430050_1
MELSTLVSCSSSVSLEITKDKGRYLVAARSFVRSELVLTENATLCTLDEATLHYCAACGKVHDLSDSDGVSHPLSVKSCEEFNILHKSFATLLDSLLRISVSNDVDLTRLKLLFQFICFQTDQPNKIPQELFDLEFNESSGLTHLSNSGVSLAVKQFHELLPKDISEKIPCELLLKLMGIFDTNSHELQVTLPVDGSPEIGLELDRPSFEGSAVFLAGAMFNHSCAENCMFETVLPTLDDHPADTVTGDGHSNHTASGDDHHPTDTVTRHGGFPVLQVRAVRPIEKGTPLSINYLNQPYLPTDERQKLLKFRYGFSCVCDRCTSDADLTRGFECPQCEEGVVYPRPTCGTGDVDSQPNHVWECIICTSTLSSVQVGECLGLESDYKFSYDAHPFNQTFTFTDDFTSPRPMKMHEAHHLHWRSLDHLLPPTAQASGIGEFREKCGSDGLARAYMYLTRCLDQILGVPGTAMASVSQHPCKLRYWLTMARVCGHSSVCRFDLAEHAYTRAITLFEARDGEATSRESGAVLREKLVVGCMARKYKSRVSSEN